MALTGDQVVITNIRLHNVHDDIVSDDQKDNSNSEGHSDRVRSSIVNVSSSGKGADEALAMTERLSTDSGLDKKDKLHLRLINEELIGLLQSIKGDVNAEYYLEVSGREYELHLNAEVELTPEMKNKFIASWSKENTESKGFAGRLKEVIGSALISRKDPVLYWSMGDYKEEIERKARFKDNGSSNAMDELERSIIANLADDISIKIEGNRVEIVVYKKFG